LLEAKLHFLDTRSPGTEKPGSRRQQIVQRHRRRQP
jgi:hypothetical protein